MGRKKRKKSGMQCCFFEDSDQLASKLEISYGLNAEKAQKLSKIELEEGYSSVSLKAIRNILPFLEIGYRYSTAVVLGGGVKNAFGERWERFEIAHDELINDIAKLIEDKKHKEYALIELVKAYLSDSENKLGFVIGDAAFKKLYHPTQAIEKRALKKRLSEIENLRNPIVQQALYEMRRLVNQLIEKYEVLYGEDFRFDRIQVEFGRNLKNNKKEDRKYLFVIEIMNKKMP